MSPTRWQRCVAALVALCAATTSNGWAAPPASTAAALPRGALLRFGEFNNAQEVLAVAYAPHGQLLVTAHADGILRLWNPASGKLVRQLEGHGGRVRAVVFAPDGRTLVSGGIDRTVRLWDVDTGKEIRARTDLPADVVAIAMSPDGKTVAPGIGDHRLWLWDIVTGKETRGTGKQPQLVASVAFTPDGRQLASASPGGFDHAIHIWDATTGMEVRSLHGHTLGIQSLAFAADGKTLASASLDGTVRFWDCGTGALRHTLEESGVLIGVMFSPDGKMLAAAQANGAIRLWETATGKFIRSVRKGGSALTSLAFAPDGTTLAAGYRDGTAVAWAVNGWGKSPPTELVADYLVPAWWSFLASTDVPQAYEAIWCLAAQPDAVPFLEERLARVAWPDSRRVATLIADLDSDAYRIRQTATDELEKQAESIAGPALRQVLAGRPSLEMHQRIDLLLRQYEQRGLLPEEARALRGVQVLEQIGTAAARQALQRLARGGTDNCLTQEARLALERLAKRQPTSAGWLVDD